MIKFTRSARLNVRENISTMIEVLKGVSGIYCFTNLVTGAMYIGSLVDPAGGSGEHLRGYNSNFYLQKKYY